MLESVMISRRQSMIRQALAELAAKPEPSEDELRSMDALDREYRTNETRYRAALIAEDQERRDAKGELETRGDRQWSDLVGRYELRQAALLLDEGKVLDGATAEVVTELRSRGGYRGVPVPWAALEVRAGETIASGTPDPIQTRPVIDRLFPASVVNRMGGQLISIDHGEVEYPVATAGAVIGWAATETGAVGSPNAYATVDRPLAPDHTLGAQMKLTRKSLKQSGAALEQAVRRDMNGAIGAEMDRVVFLGTGGSGQPTGLIAGATGLGIGEEDIEAPASWAAFRAAVTRFIVANAAAGPGAVKLLARPELWNFMDETLSQAAIELTGTAVSEWDRLVKNLPGIVLSSNALPAPTGTPVATSAVLTTNVGGVAPVFVGTWGAIDLIRDPYSDAASGMLRLTALATMDVTISRPVQIEILHKIELEAEGEGGGGGG